MGSNSKHTRNDGARVAYADWLRLPKTERLKIAANDRTFPKSKKEFSEHYGVSTVALWKWEQDKDFRSLVHSRAMGTILTAEETEKAIAELKGLAFNSQVSPSTRLQALKTLLNTVGMLSPRESDKPEEEEIDFGKWTDEELAAFVDGDDGDSDD